MHIQPEAKSCQLRRGDGHLDQLDIIEQVLALWEHDLELEGRVITASRGLRSPRNGALLAWPVGTGKTPGALRLLYAWKERLTELGDPRADLPSIVVCDASTKPQWLVEVARWVPEWPSGYTLNIDGAKTDVDMQFAVHDICKHIYLFVTNYEKVVTYLPEFLERGPYLMVIADEIRRIKNASTQRNQALDALACYYRVGLDGTPLTKWPDSLHGILSWLMPGPRRTRDVKAAPMMPDGKCFFGTDARFRILHKFYSEHGCSGCQFMVAEQPWKGTCAFSGNELEGSPPRTEFYHEYSREWGQLPGFAARYCKYECPRCGAIRDNEEKIWSGGDPGCTHNYARVTGGVRTEELKRRLTDDTHIMWSIDRSKIKGFPTVTPRLVECPLTHIQSRFYRQAEHGLIEFLSREGDRLMQKPINNVMSHIAWLRACATLPPAVVLERLRGVEEGPEWLTSITIPPEMDGGKQLWLLDFLNDYVVWGEDKAIIFSEWTHVTYDAKRRVDELLHPMGRLAIHIHGGMGADRLEARKQDFNHDPRFSVAVCSPAGSAGLNLHEAFVGKNGVGTLWVVHMDTGWVATDIEQRTGRAQRTGFDGAGIVSNFVIAKLDDGSDTIDSRMAARVMARAEVSDLVTGTNLRSMFNFRSMSDIMSLLGR